MKKRFPVPDRRLPIDFGDEPVCHVPIRVVPPRRRKPFKPACHFNLKRNNPGDVNLRRAKNSSGSTASPSTGGEGRGEGELNPSFLLAGNSNFIIQHSPLPKRGGFTLVEILVVLALLSLIVFALMAVFSSTQRAFRASITQTDTLEGGRAVMDLIAADLEAMTPSYGISNTAQTVSAMTNAINFSVSYKPLLQPYPPVTLIQPLIGSPTGVLRTNVLEDIFILSKGNLNGVPSWIATGYSVGTNLPDGTLYPLYRFYMATNVMSGSAGQAFLYSRFYNAISSSSYTNLAWSHLIDGVVHLTARTYDTNGVMITNGYANPLFATVPHNVFFGQSFNGEMGCIYYSNAVPASVQIEMGTLEDRTLAHAESLTGAAQSNYLANASGQLHIFEKRVWIRNLDLSAYQ